MSSKRKSGGGVGAGDALEDRDSKRRKLPNHVSYFIFMVSRGEVVCAAALALFWCCMEMELARRRDDLGP